MNRRNSALLASAAAVAGLLSVPTLALAQSSGAGGPSSGATAGPGGETASGPMVGEVVVTAQRRAERQVDVPITITALNPQQLAVANVQNLADIQKITPALRFDNQTGFFQPEIRGIGTGITTSGGGANVGIYIDGFYSLNPMAADFQLTKVQSIQVLKGPQGTLFGRNTTGGAILITTADPSTTPAFEAKASYARFNTAKFQAYGTYGLTDNIALDLEGMYTRGDGFITNIMNGSDKWDKYKSWTMRAGLKFFLGDNATFLLRYQHSDQNDPSGQMLNSNVDPTTDITTGRPWGVQTYQVPGTYTTDPDEVAQDVRTIIHTKTNILQGTLKVDLGFADLTSYSQFREEKSDQSENLDQVGLPIFQLGLPIHDKTWSQEFLLTSHPGPKLQWTAGLFAFSSKDVWITRIDNNPADHIRLGGSGTTTYSLAGFIDATYQLTEKLFLTAGVRYSHDGVKDAYWNTAFTALENPVPNISSNKATPRVVIRYKPTESSSVYASYAKGFKAAIIDVGGSCQDGPLFECNPIKPENIDAYEVGYKYHQGPLSFETSAYYYNYKNLQVSEFLGNAQAFIINAAKSEIYGIDGAIRYDWGDHLQLNAGGAWTHARYKQFGGQIIQGQMVGAPVYASCPAAGPSALAPKYAGACTNGNTNYVNTDTVLHNVHMQHSPDFTANVGARWTTGMTDTGEYSLAGSVYYTSKIYFSPSGTQFLQNGYATLDARAEWLDPTRRYTLAIFGENLTNKRYRTQVQYNGFGIGASWSAPVTWGVEAGVKF
jgi:iron complex outermembrane receptor protein